MLPLAPVVPKMGKSKLRINSNKKKRKKNWQKVSTSTFYLGPKRTISKLGQWQLNADPRPSPEHQRLGREAAARPQHPGLAKVTRSHSVCYL